MDNKIDVNPIIDKIQVPSNLKGIYDKAIISGMRVMFAKESHQAFLSEVNKPGPMDEKLANGIVGLVYILWEKSNKTLPPQILIPITTVLTLKAYDFLQQSGNPDATKEVLGDGLHKAVERVMGKFGVQPDQVEQIVRKNIQGQGMIQGAQHG